MNRIKASVLLTLISFVTIFAQEQERAPRPDRADYTNRSGGMGGQFSGPIDDYTILLIGIAVLIIAYVIYNKRKSTLA